MGDFEAFSAPKVSLWKDLVSLARSEGQPFGVKCSQGYVLGDMSISFGMGFG